MREILKQIRYFCDALFVIIIHMDMDVGGAFRVDAFHGARVRPASLRQVAFTHVEWQPSLVFIHLRVDEVAWFIGWQLWMARVNFVDVHVA